MSLHFERLREAIDWWAVQAIEEDESDANLLASLEDGWDINLRWGIALHTREIKPDRWVWMATTAGDETVVLTGKLLEIASCYPLWIWGQPGAMCSIRDSSHVLGDDEPAMHITLSHFIRSRPLGMSTEIVSYHVADKRSKPLYLLTNRRIPGWPP